MTKKKTSKQTKDAKKHLKKALTRKDLANEIETVEQQYKTVNSHIAQLVQKLEAKKKEGYQLQGKHVALKKLEAKLQD